ncbi:hypothetical protein KM188_05825 [Mycetohabitans sp. B4]|nr:hypothetical protein [Mycetohabitans sp. B3]MCG1018284.1 hypothetical protein [Mycetohabitans sp. B4]MCG1039162.1 hypothetical protein [Mycetohabitans sp. B7]
MADIRNTSTAFALNRCDREATNWATTGGHSGDIVHDVMLAAVKHRFGNALKAPAETERLTNHCSGYTAEKTRAFVGHHHATA